MVAVFEKVHALMKDKRRYSTKRSHSCMHSSGNVKYTDGGALMIAARIVSAYEQEVSLRDRSFLCSSGLSLVAQAQYPLRTKFLHRRILADLRRVQRSSLSCVSWLVFGYVYCTCTCSCAGQSGASRDHGALPLTGKPKKRAIRSDDSRLPRPTKGDIVRPLLDTCGRASAFVFLCIARANVYSNIPLYITLPDYLPVLVPAIHMEYDIAAFI